jgi:Raf kinase inhibitor-like YbhB/YbcL family protein
MPDLELTSPSFDDGEPIPKQHTADGEGRSPGLRWNFLPDGTKTLALIVHDPDAPSGDFVHWLAWNIDPSSGGLPEGVAADASGLVQGRNSRGNPGYFGPRPHGGQPHHYHFQLFALDAPLTLAGGADREALLAAMNGHVVAKGDLVGLFAEPPR